VNEEKNITNCSELFHKLSRGKEPTGYGEIRIPQTGHCFDRRAIRIRSSRNSHGGEKAAEEYYDNLSENVEERGIQEILCTSPAWSTAITFAERRIRTRDAG